MRVSGPHGRLEKSFEMEFTLEVPDYDKYQGIVISLVGDHEIEVVFKNGEVGIRANKDGLISLATQMLTLAQDTVPSGHHIHLGSNSGLEENSLGLIIGKK